MKNIKETNLIIMWDNMKKYIVVRQTRSCGRLDDVEEAVFSTKEKAEKFLLKSKATKRINKDK